MLDRAKVLPAAKNFVSRAASPWGVGLNLRPALSKCSLFILLIFGLPLLLIDLGNARVLTRHEVLAAQPGREMLYYWHSSRWVLPTLAGAFRTAKPPGMMWLIALSLAIFRTSAEWASRMPSALSAMLLALVMARFAARWFGDRVGLIAGLIQLTSLYVLIQSRLAEADMALTLLVTIAVTTFASAVIDSPVGLDQSTSSRRIFWICLAGCFLLKGPVGIVFVALAIATFSIVRRRGLQSARDKRELQFVFDPIGIAVFAILVIGWPLSAYFIHPAIVHDWLSEIFHTASGQIEHEPFYYYLYSSPLMLLPWLPFGIHALLTSATSSSDQFPPRKADLFVLRNIQKPRLQAFHLQRLADKDRALLWQFFCCWMIPGLLFLSAIKQKHHHYAMPLLPAMTIPAAVGLSRYTRWRQVIWNPSQVQTAAAVLLSLTILATVLFHLPHIPLALKHPILMIILLITCGAILALFLENARLPRLTLIVCFVTIASCALAVQGWIMPVQDDFRYQADLAKRANLLVPPNVTIYMLGSREEEQEAQYSYYLRFPMQRLTSVAALSNVADQNRPLYAIAPTSLHTILALLGSAKTLTTCAGLRSGESEANRLELVQISSH